MPCAQRSHNELIPGISRREIFDNDAHWHGDKKLPNMKSCNTTYQHQQKTTSYWNSGWIIQHQPAKSKNIHPRNLTYPLKNDGWKMSFLLGLPIFRGYVKFPGCTEKQRKMWHSFGQIQRIDLSITSSAWTRVERVSWPNSWDSFWLQVFFVQSNIPF